MTHSERAKNLVTGAGGFENIKSFHYDAEAGICITVRDAGKTSYDIIRQDEHVTDISGHGEEMTVRIEPDTEHDVYNELCALALLNEDQKAPGSRDSAGKKYTPDYFVNIAKEAVEGMPVTHMEKNLVMGFVMMIAEDAARFANEKGLDDDFSFVPGFVDAVSTPREEDGATFISGNVFVDAEEKAHISIQYQKKGDKEACNLLVTDIETGDSVTYAGKMSGPAGSGELEDKDGSAVCREEEGAETGAPVPVDGRGQPLLLMLVLVIFITISSLIFGALPFGTEQEDDRPAVSYQEETPSPQEEETPSQQEASTDEDLQQMVEQPLNGVMLFMKVVGILFLLLGVTTLVLAWQCEDHDRMTRASTMIATGITMTIVATLCSSLFDALTSSIFFPS